jgi:DNA-binding transcriptional LysR family regulator
MITEPLPCQVAADPIDRTAVGRGRGGPEAQVEVTQRQLRAFSVVAHELNFSRAAALLHISQPALSLCIQQLEKALGVRLLERNTRAVALTDAGIAFLDKLTPALTALDEAVTTARGWATGAIGVLRIGYLIGAGLEELPRLLRDFSTRYPNVRVETVEYDFSDPSAGLRTGDVDIALIRPPIDLDIETLVLSHEGWVACVAADHPFATRSEVPLAEVLAEPIVAAPSSAGSWRDYWIAADYRLTAPATIVAEAATFESEFNTVAQGKGISITVETAARYYRRPGVTFVPISDAPPCSVALAWLQDEHPPAMAQFVDVARTLAL